MKERNYQARRSCPETEHPCMCPREGYVWFLNSELVCGNLGKSCLAGRGLFYSLLREHGETSAAWAMNRLTKMCTRWLSAHGFTIGIDDVIPPTSASLKEIYDEHKDEDGFLYMTYAGENTFGCPDIH